MTERMVEETLEALSSDHERLKKNVELLLAVVGNKGRCDGCGAEIWWVKTRKGKNAPYTREALNHFADCPAAELFRR